MLSDARSRAEFSREATFHLGVLAACVIAFLACLVTWGMQAVRRPPASRDGRIARACAVCVAGANLAFVFWLAASLRDLGAITPLPASTLVLLSLPLVSLLLTALLPVFAARAWRSRWWTRRGRLAYSTFALLAVAFMTFLNYWKLLAAALHHWRSRWIRDSDETMIGRVGWIAQ